MVQVGCTSEGDGEPQQLICWKAGRDPGMCAMAVGLKGEGDIKTVSLMARCHIGSDIRIAAAPLAHKFQFSRGLKWQGHLNVVFFF